MDCMCVRSKQQMTTYNNLQKLLLLFMILCNSNFRQNKCSTMYKVKQSFTIDDLTFASVCVVFSEEVQNYVNLSMCHSGKICSLCRKNLSSCHFHVHLDVLLSSRELLYNCTSSISQLQRLLSSILVYFSPSPSGTITRRKKYLTAFLGHLPSKFQFFSHTDD